MTVVTDIKFRMDYVWLTAVITKQEVLIDDDGRIYGFGEPIVEELIVGPQ